MIDNYSFLGSRTPKPPKQAPKAAKAAAAKAAKATASTKAANVISAGWLCVVSFFFLVQSPSKFNPSPNDASPACVSAV